MYNAETIFKFNPEIDTLLSSKLVKDQFALINAGMDRNEVVKLLGEPFEKHEYLPGSGSCWNGESNNIGDFNLGFNFPSIETLQEEIWSFSKDGACSWFDFAWLEYRVVFLDGIVVRTERCWHGD